MDLNDLLNGRGLKPEQVCVMRHTRKSEKNFQDVLEKWARNEPDKFNAYQRGQSGPAGSSLAKAKYLASFIGHEPGKAKFVGLYDVRSVRQVPLKEFLAFPENQALVELGYPFHRDRPFRRWFDLRVIKGFDDLKLKLVIDWPGRPNSWCRWADRNEFTILQGSDLVRNMLAERESEPSPEGIRTQLNDVEVQLTKLGELDERRETLARKEQALLREHLFRGGKFAACFICGEKLPVELLVAAHIKPRAECSADERRDLANIAPMCLLGCDALFERRHVAVVDGGIDIRLNAHTSGTCLNTFLKVLRGRRILIEPERLKYFQWHAAHKTT